MSEYYFEYTCLSCDGEKQRTANNRVNQDQKFVLFQDYGMNGALCVQVLLDVPKNYQGVRVYHIENGIDVPKVFDSEIHKRSEFISREKIIKNGGFYIRSHNRDSGGEYSKLSGTGIFALVKDEFCIPAPAETYTYSINFGAKQEIIYSIIEKRNELVIDIAYPLLRNNLKLLLFSHQGSKPLEKAYRERSNFEPIILKSGIKDYLHIKRAVRNTEGFDFRLFFANEEDAKYYLLVDESLETVEEKKLVDTIRHEDGSVVRLRRSTTGRYYDDFGKIHVKKCPYCFRPMNLPDNYNKGRGYTVCECGGSSAATQGHLLSLSDNTKIQPKLHSTKHIVCCGYDYRKEDKAFTTEALYKHLILPTDYMDKPSMNVALIGATNSGKSVILSTLLGARSYLQEQMVRSGASREDAQANATSYLLNSIVSRFDTKKSGTGVELFDLAQVRIPEEKKNDDFTTLSECKSTSEIDIDNTTGGSRTQQLIRERYMVEVGRALPRHTEGTDIKFCGLHPFVFRMGNLGYSFFYDIPGEVFKSTRKETNMLRGVRNADCLVLIINGYAKDHLNDSIREVEDGLEAAAKIMGKEKLYNTPVAVVLAKFDMLQDAFDDNCHILRENILHMIDQDRSVKRGVYANSAVEKHIAYSSYEIKHYLASQGEINFVNNMKKFTYLKYFAASALGSDDCYSHDAQKVLKFHERPLRLELPIIWLMYQMGLIKE